MKKYISIILLILYVFYSMPISAQENTKEILPEHRLQTGNVVMPDSLNVATMGTAVARDSGK